MGKSFERAYYENADLWSPSKFTGLQEQRAQTTIDWLPEDVCSVLDVGCGNGVITNLLPGKNNIDLVFGVDRSYSSLQHVKTMRSQTDAGNLPFRDNQFDALISTEVIEHLPYFAYQQVLNEYFRVARRYILISVPYKEEYELLKVECPACTCSFHRNYHMRTFDHSDLERLFINIAGVRLVRLEGVFPIHRYKFSSSWHAWKKLRAKLLHLDTNFNNLICPQCGYTEIQGSLPPNSVTPVGEINSSNGFGPGRLSDKIWSKLGVWSERFWPKRHSYRWWLALYRKP